MQTRDQLYANAEKNLDDAAITSNYPAHREQIIASLNDALATEIVCTLRYKRHFHMASGFKAEVIASELWEHAEQEMAHADKLASRIAQLGGEPDFNPTTLDERSHARYTEGTTLYDIVKENLLAERIAVENYRSLVRTIGNDDPTTRRMLEEILADEEEHADDMAALLTSLDNE